MHPAKLLGPPKPSLDNSSISPRGLGGRWKFSESGISIDHVWVDIGYQLSFEVMAELV